MSQPGPVDLSALRDRKTQPGEKVPMRATIVGQVDGPWAVVDDGGITIALGFGDNTRGAMLAMMSLAALATRVATPEAVAEAIQAAHLAIACQRIHPGEECKPGQNHPARAE